MDLNPCSRAIYKRKQLHLGNRDGIRYILTRCKPEVTIICSYTPTFFFYCGKFSHPWAPTMTGYGGNTFCDSFFFLNHRKNIDNKSRTVREHFSTNTREFLQILQILHVVFWTLRATITVPPHLGYIILRGNFYKTLGLGPKNEATNEHCGLPISHTCKMRPETSLKSAGKHMHGTIRQILMDLLWIFFFKNSEILLFFTVPPT